MSYLYLIIPLVLGIIDFVFEARDKSRKGFFRQITFSGWVYIALTVFLMYGIWKGIQDDNKYKVRMESYVTGGDSYPIAIFTPYMCSERLLYFTIEDKGDYSLEDLSIGLFDIDEAYRGYRERDTNALKNWVPFNQYFPAIGANMVLLPPLKIPIAYVEGMKERYFLLSIATKYSNFDQYIKFRRKDGKSYFASRILNHNTKKVILDTIYDGFLNSGETIEDIKWIPFTVQNLTKG